MPTVQVRSHYYQQFDADLSLPDPGLAYGGWQSDELPLSLEHTAVVVMHAWDAGTPEAYPGWFRAVEYLPRSYRIAQEVFPPLLAATRASGMRVVHVVGGPAHYYRDLPEYVRPTAAPERPAVCSDEVSRQLRRFRAGRVFPGAHNVPDITRGQASMGFLPSAVPAVGEPVVSTSESLSEWCRAAEVNHLIYTGFAINGCLLTSPAGMLDMFRLGYLCSTVAEAVTAIERKETVREEAGKAQALWFVALLFGFVYHVGELIDVLDSSRVPGSGA